MRLKFCYILLLFLIPLEAFPQPNVPGTRTYLPDIPTAAELFKYVSHPVSHSTGLVDITIPIYEIKVGDVTLPIYLKYHSSGIKVTEAPSWVGAGWTLVAEPVISRSAEGSPDEQYFGRQQPAQPNAMSIMDLQSWYDYHNYDFAPDNFYYRLPDKSGGFYYPRNVWPNSQSQRTPVIHPYEPLTVKEIATSSQGVISGFEITDEKGMTYLFDGVFEHIQSGSKGSRSAWKCTSIKSRSMNRTLINFTYESVSDRRSRIIHDAGEVEFMQNEVDTHQSLPGISLSGYTSSLMSQGVVSNLGQEQAYYYTITKSKIPYEDSYVNAVQIPYYEVPMMSTPVYQISEKRLSTINWGNGNYIRFTSTKPSNFTNPVISKIEVYVGGKIIRTVDLDYSLLGGGRDLFILNNLVVKGSDSAAVERYKFNYFNPESFPTTSYRNFDYWGYKSGNAPTNINSVPFQTITIKAPLFEDWNNKQITLGVGRAAYFNDALTGTLSSIVYPTGGKTCFTYEFHRFKDPVLQSSIRGINEGAGLRIKKVEDYVKETDQVPVLIRSYKYGEGENGLGFCYDFPYIERFRSQSERWYYGSNGSFKTSLVWSLSHSPLPHTSGSPISAPVAYNYVTEYTGDSLKTVYKFNYSENTFRSMVPQDATHPGFWDHRNDWASGQKLEEIHFNKTGGTYTPVLSREYRYANFMERTDVTYDVFKAVQRIGQYNSWEILHSDYLILQSPIYSGCSRLVETRETTHDGNRTAVVTTTNTYNATKKHMYPSKTTVIQSNGSVMENEYKYPEDLALSGDAETGRSKLVELGAYGVLLEENRKVDGSYVSSAGYDYKLFRNPNFPHLWNVNSGESPQTREKRATFMDYTNSGLPLCIRQDEATNVIYVWANYGNNMIAEVKNMDLSAFLASVPHSMLDGLFATHCTDSHSIYAILNNIRSNPSIHVTSYIYGTSSELLKVIDPSGRAVSYEYDNLNRLKLARNQEGEIIERYDYNYRNR
ncbi:hypothetical protein [Bacteroides sp. UBA939]|uniref:hypothetical protein n=1 Tax=Bacteroides sp. UBA939 TaxID=1946092 RepID=UPI0025C1DF61|nr:hypothetical protein [Bacteroides sp. UBA939]